MNDSLKIYKENITKLLEELADKNYQERIWLNTDNPDNLVSSFIEAVNMLFDDSAVSYLLETEQIIIDQSVTTALAELHDATDAVNEFRPTEDIIADPLMDIVRQKAALALELVKASDGSESTVEIVE